MDKRVFIFDLDGTLIDTTRIGFRKINFNLLRLGYPAVSDEFLRSHWGKPAQEIFQLVCEHVKTSEKEFHDFCRYDKTMLGDYFLDPDLMPALMRLKNTGAILGILTSRTSESANRLADKIDFDLQFFNFLQTEDHHHWRKPDGRVFDPLLAWTAARGIDANEVVYFGDTIDYDLAATQKAKTPIDFVAVTSGVNTREEFILAGVSPTKIIDGCENLPVFLEAIVLHRLTRMYNG